ncbi:hypothetical protein ABT009_45210 [Streptomyces sp. NPDC002896]
MPAWLHYVPAKGWMNDPNGLIHWQGRHHPPPLLPVQPGRLGMPVGP